MDTATTGHPEPNTMPEAQPQTQAQTQAKPQPSAQSKASKSEGRPPAANKYAEARLAKKKQRRRAHRATIRRSNTNG